MQGKHFDEIVSFVEISRRKSFVRAAEALGVQGSVISRRITNLEASLNTRLLARSTRQVELTAAGALFLRHCDAALASFAEAYGSLTESKAQAVGRLRISAPVTFGRLYVAPFLPIFLKRHAGVEISAQFSDTYVDFVQERVDLAIRISRMQSSSLVGKPLVSNERFLVASPDYVARRGLPTNPRALKEHDCLTFTQFSDPALWRLQSGKTSVSVKLNPRLQADAADTVHQAALVGVGITQLARFLVHDDLQAGRLVRVLPKWQAPESVVHALYPDKLSISGSARRFTDEFGAYLLTRTPWLKGAAQTR
jgi:DNA-binding transcriptional LysR family regulator